MARKKEIPEEIEDEEEDEDDEEEEDDEDEEEEEEIEEPKKKRAKKGPKKEEPVWFAYYLPEDSGFKNRLTEEIVKTNDVMAIILNKLEKIEKATENL